MTCGDTEWRTGRDLWKIAKAADSAQVWTLGGSRVTTVRIGDRTFRKLFEPPDVLGALLRDLLAAGLSVDVSSWAGVWRQWRVWPTPLPKKSEILNPLPGASPVIVTPYAWIEQRRVGDASGCWREWDIKSAYAWSTMMGLPDQRTVTEVSGDTISDDAIYLVEGVKSEWREPEQWTLPTWLRPRAPRVDHERAHLFDAPTRKTHRLTWVPGETLNRLCLSPTKVVRAYEWRRRLDMRAVFDSIRSALPTYYKSVFRAHWGDWGAGSSVTRETWRDGKRVSRNEMPQGMCAPLWSWLVQARVCDRLARVAEHAQRLFIDSAVLPEELTPSPVGGEVGDWALKHEWPDGCRLNPLPWKPADLDEVADARRFRTFRGARVPLR